MQTTTTTPFEDVQAAREELAYHEDIGRAKDLRLAIIVNERALPHLRGIPRVQAEARIAKAKEDLVTVDLSIRLYEADMRRVKRAAKRSVKRA